ncbi:anaphase-promoting complex subunit 5 [Ischnura elegans]|uniref:anaphase-promoting complex subunit 5 n=1 Tax=Ischnura elegans TaxID=197161 RepID=UPI001ED8B59D|nr:anaphase-promoting complex subunit 5 [Ischnura elegans]
MSGSKETLNFGVMQKKSVIENITPHKIAVVLLILEYFYVKKKASPTNRTDFCMLMLKLIQCPDMDLEELLSLLKSGKYALIPAHIENFESQLMGVYRKGVAGLLDIIQNVIHILVEPTELFPGVNKSSVIGLYSRRIIVCMDKLSFSQVVRAYQNYKIYYEKAQRKHDVPKEPKATQKSDQDSYMNIFGDGTSIEIDFSCAGPEKSALWHDVDVGCWSRRQAELFIAQQAALLETNESAALPPPVLQERMLDLLKANPKCAEAHYLCYLNCMRVKEFCGAVHSLHHCFDRSTVVADSKGITQDEKNKGFRYAALNLAALHTQFGHKESALSILNEAIKIAHEANDNVCLQHALSWLYKLADSNKRLLIQRSISKSTDLGLMYLASLGMQSLAQHDGLNGGKPSSVFELVTESDVLNCQHSMGDLAACSYALKSALWNLYGETEMASLNSQLLLLLNTDDETPGSVGGNSEGLCLAICNVTNYFIHEGEYNMALVVLQLAREKFPRGSLSTHWMLSEQLLTFTRANYNCQWHVAEQAAKSMASFDPWESKLRMIELCVSKGEHPNALILAKKILALCQNWMEKCGVDELPGQKNCGSAAEMDSHCSHRSEHGAETQSLPSPSQPLPFVPVRALILLAEANFNTNFRAAVSCLTTALSLAHRYHLEYLSAVSGVVMADLQLRMGLSSQALGVLEQCLPVILSHGSRYMRAKAMMVLVQCKLAASATRLPRSSVKGAPVGGEEEGAVHGPLSPPSKKEILEECVRVLEGVKTDLEKVESISLLKDVLVLQACMYRELGRVPDCQKSALEYKALVQNSPLLSFTKKV